MKRKVFLASILIIGVLGFITYHYLINDYKRIDIYTADGFNKGSTMPSISISDKLTLMEFSAVIKTSHRMKGMLNVSYPKYVIEIYSYNKTINTIYLWIDKKSPKGMYMYKNNTSTGYSIPRVSTKLLMRLLSY